VRQPQDYRWSSYGFNAQGRKDALLQAHEQYLRLGKDEVTRREAYRALFKAHLDDPVLAQIRQATNGNYALGNPRFQAQVETALGRRASRASAGRPRHSARAET
jgi:putative transposase